ncbi:MAG: hypothetical protein V7K41_25585 [Nostoc sp.]|uniref:hypothetical protein n=1 Tax=Nostoc sp. TaxID=1180 RepID=UPI002FFBCD47
MPAASRAIASQQNPRFSIHQKSDFRLDIFVFRAVYSRFDQDFGTTAINRT